jgi:hypothetical protein
VGQGVSPLRRLDAAAESKFNGAAKNIFAPPQTTKLNISNQALAPPDQKVRKPISN